MSILTPYVQWGLHHEKLEMQLDLCVDETGKVPLWTEMKGVDNGTEFVPSSPPQMTNM